MAENNEQNKKNYRENWVLQGLIWGVLMIFFMEVLFPLSQKDPITLKSLAIGIPLWLIGGLVMGYVFKDVLNKKAKDSQPLHNHKSEQ